MSIDKHTADQISESQLRGAGLEGSDQAQAADHLQAAKRRKNDEVLRTDGEKDTLYEDGIELDDDSAPLTAINGVDDSVRSSD